MVKFQFSYLQAGAANHKNLVVQKSSQGVNHFVYI